MSIGVKTTAKKSKGMFRTWVWQKQELYARDPQQQLDSLHLWVGGYGISVLSPIKQQQLPGGSTTNHMPCLSTSFFIFLPVQINYKPWDAQSQHLSLLFIISILIAAKTAAPRRINNKPYALPASQHISFFIQSRWAYQSSELMDTPIWNVWMNIRVW